jgi:2-keto-4-pentenoate hydratase/2-oxohepta-3-ene-1,7-dioic acid hydratase in catechol pathway
MKIIRFQYNRGIPYGVIEGDAVRVYSGSPFASPGKSAFRPSGILLNIKAVTMLSPCRPSKVVCLGLNYKPHGDELKMELPGLPLLFLKPSTAVIGPYDNIILPPGSERIDYECELGVVISKTARNVKESDYSDYVLGYTCFNDVTDRVAQAKDGQWTRAKGHDTFAPLGPCIETTLTHSNLKIETHVNGNVVQSGNTSEMIFPVPHLVSFISHIMTLLPGDVIATGTPAGIGPLKDGDSVEVIIENIGTLRNHVLAAPE